MMEPFSLLGQLVSADEATAWAATFLLHSTMLIIAVWLLTRLLGMRAMAIQDRLWKVALLGALVSCSVQAGLGERSRAPQITIPLGAAAAAAPGDTAVRPSAGTAVERLHPAGMTFDPAVQGAVQAAPFPRSSIWPRAFLLFWCFGAAVLTGSLVLQLLRLRSRLSDRQEVVSGPVHREFRSLTAACRRRGRPIRLTVSSRITVPAAYGIRRPEVCLPVSLLRGSAPGILKSILAHELAHIERRDQCWLLAARIIESIFFFQPLVRLARRCYQETAEFICDGVAVHKTGERIPLARTLHEMACRQVSATTTPMIPGISGKGAPLNRRIEMILDTNRSSAGPDRSRWFGPLVLALILAFALLAPGVTAADDPAPLAAHESGAPEPPSEPQPVLDGEPEAPSAPESPEPPAAPDEEALREAEAAELAELEVEMAAAEREMAVEAADMAEMERQMEAEAEAMRKLELEMAAAEETMAAEEREMAEAEREMALMEEELAAHLLELDRAERELAEKEEALVRELEAMEEKEAEAGGGSDDDLSREEARARELEIRRRHEAIRDHHRDITRRHREISREHRDIARRQVETLRQRQAVFHSEETALVAERRGLQRALERIDRSLAGELTDEQRERLLSTKSDLEERLRRLDAREADLRAATDEAVPRPEELE